MPEKPQFDEFPKYELNDPKFGIRRTETRMERKLSVRLLKISVYMTMCSSFLEIQFVTDDLQKLKLNEKGPPIC